MEAFAVINQAIAVTGSLTGIFGLAYMLGSRYLDRGTKRFFAAFFSILFFYVLFDLSLQLCTSRWARAMSAFMESVAAGLLLPLLTKYFLYAVGERDWRRDPSMQVSLGLFLVYLALLVYTQFSDIIYTFSADGVYRRGPAYPVLLVPPLLSLINSQVLFFRRKGALSREQRNAFLIYMTVPLLCLLVQMRFYGVHAIVFGITVSLQCMFLYILRDQADRYLQKEKENQRLKTDLMLAQIQPHFLYNALLTIREVCLQDPGKAADAIGDFTGFLRHNMESLDSDRPVPFRDELKHVREYLQLERLRFGEDLQVEYHIGCEDFRLPTLTLQPIVENAVRYGVRKNGDGRGSVVIRTWEEPSAWQVSVEDDGPGFPAEAYAPEEQGPHIGLKNVRERLRLLSGGMMQIRTEKGRGTTVTLTIPKEGA